MHIFGATLFPKQCSVQFSSRWYVCARKSPHALHRVSPSLGRFPNVAFETVLVFARLTDDGPLSSFKGRSSSASSFHASLLQTIDGVMSLVLCPQVVSQASQHFRSSEKQATCDGCFAASLSARSFPFTPAFPRQYTHKSFRTSAIDTF